jgi:hypothetical protein
MVSSLQPVPGARHDRTIDSLQSLCPCPRQKKEGISPPFLLAMMLVSENGPKAKLINRSMILRQEKHLGITGKQASGLIGDV